MVQRAKEEEEKKRLRVYANYAVCKKKNKRLGLQLWAYSLFLWPEVLSSTHPSKNPVDHELGYRDRFLHLTRHTFGRKQILDRTHRGYTLAVRGAIVEGLLISK